MARSGDSAGGVSSLLIANENLRRELASKDSEVTKLKGLLDERDRKLDVASSARLAATKEAERHRRDSDQLTRELATLREERTKTSAALAEATAYGRKLELAITSHGKDVLVDQNSKLKATLVGTRADLEAAQRTITQQKAEIDRALREIEVLVRGPLLHSLVVASAEGGGGCVVHLTGAQSCRPHAGYRVGDAGR